MVARIIVVFKRGVFIKLKLFLNREVGIDLSTEVYKKGVTALLPWCCEIQSFRRNVDKGLAHHSDCFY
jgi:hypothetical protein